MIFRVLYFWFLFSLSPHTLFSPRSDRPIIIISSIPKKKKLSIFLSLNHRSLRLLNKKIQFFTMEKILLFFYWKRLVVIFFIYKTFAKGFKIIFCCSESEWERKEKHVKLLNQTPIGLHHTYRTWTSANNFTTTCLLWNCCGAIK